MTYSDNTKSNIPEIGYCITTYRETNFEILRAINSALIQTNPENILLLIDYNDKIQRNKLKKICHSKKINYHFFKDNVGVSRSRNYGIDFFKNKSYKYIAFLDADDFYIADISCFIKTFEKDSSIEIISGGMIERSIYYEMQRQGNINEIIAGGNPVYLSSSLFRLTDYLSFDEKIRIREDRDIVHRIGFNKIVISSQIITIKNNLPGRTNSDLVNSVIGDQNSIKNKILAIYWKLKSIKKLRIFLVRYLFYLTFKLFSFSKINKKSRFFLSINFKSMEFLNVKKISKMSTFNIYKQFFETKYTRDPFILDKHSLKDYLISFFSSQSSQYKYIYVGLPGARIIRSVIDNIQYDAQTIHLIHGRLSSKKFLKFTDAAIAKVADSYNTNKIFFYKENPKIINYEKNKLIWIHGFKKGKGNYLFGFRGYFSSNLIEDCKYLFSIENEFKYLYVSVHPAARKLFYFLKIYSFFKKNIYLIDINKHTSLSCHSIYLSSPTIIEKINNKTIKIDEKITVYNLRNDLY